MIVTQAAAGSLLGISQSGVGDIAVSNGLAEGSFEKIALHGVVGASYSMINGSGPLSGAVGGAVSEAISPNIGEFASPSGVAGFAASTSMFISGGDARDIEAAGSVASSAMENNNLLHPSFDGEVEESKQRRLIESAEVLADGTAEGARWAAEHPGEVMDVAGNLLSLAPAGPVVRAAITGIKATRAIGAVAGKVSGVEILPNASSFQGKTLEHRTGIEVKPVGAPAKTGEVVRGNAATKTKPATGATTTTESSRKGEVYFEKDAKVENVKHGRAIRQDAIPEGSELEYIAPGRVRFDGVEFRAVRDLGHLKEHELIDMARKGINPNDVSGQRLDGHHFKQQYHREKGTFVVEIPENKHNIGNKVQHPLGNKGGLTIEERKDWNTLRKSFNKERARNELLRRGIDE